MSTNSVPSTEQERRPPTHRKRRKGRVPPPTPSWWWHPTDQEWIVNSEQIAKEEEQERIDSKTAMEWVVVVMDTYTIDTINIIQATLWREWGFLPLPLSSIMILEPQQKHRQCIFHHWASPCSFIPTASMMPIPRMLVCWVYRGRLEDKQPLVMQGATRPEEDEWSILLLLRSGRWEPASPWYATPCRIVLHQGW